VLAALAYASFEVDLNVGGEEIRDEVFRLEADVLEDFDSLRPYILRMQREYPDLFDQCGSFFRTAMAAPNPYALLESRRKRLRALHRASSWRIDWKFLGIDTYQKAQAARKLAATPASAAPTVGRNDPCPCGSGKKYKKCCMVS
jgi:hypothetical protein